MAEEGELIAGRYLIKNKIGQGGMSSVYLGLDTNLGKEWAVKIIKKNSQDFFVSSALAEANLMKRLDHPSLPRIVDIIDEEDYIYVVMDYIEGETLGDYLRINGKVKQEKVIEWAIDLCGVLEYLHNQQPPIIYRDMKPDNIMLMQNGQIKLIDFGIAREYKDNNIQDTVCLGTKGYAAPEQFGGQGQSDRRTDIYCLGVTLYHLVTGKNPCEPPYRIFPIRHWDPMLSPGLESIIARCTQPEPEERYEDCTVLKNALQNYEKEDVAYKKKRRRQLFIYRACAALSVVFLYIGIIASKLEQKVRIQSFENFIAKSENALTKEEKENLIIDAINEMPGEISGYEKLIALYKEDGIFSQLEEGRLCDILDNNKAVLHKHEDYGELAYEVAVLYWYYYYYEDNGNLEENANTGIKRSICWYQEAVTYGQKKEYRKKAEIYYLLGVFTRDIAMNMEEEKDKGLYLAYFDNLYSLLSLCGQDIENTGPDNISLSALKMIVNSMDTYFFQFSKDGVSIDRMEQLYKDTCELVQKTEYELINDNMYRDMEETIRRVSYKFEAANHNK